MGNRPPSIVSTTSTLDEGGFNEPYPEIKAKLKPHSTSNVCDVSNKDLDKQEVESSKEESKNDSNQLQPIKSKESIEALYAVPHKPSSLMQQKSTVSTDSEVSQQKSTTTTDSEVSQMTVIQQKSVDSDIMYNNPPEYITNSVLSQLETQESYEKACREFLQREKEFESNNRVLKNNSEKSVSSEEVNNEKTDLDISDVNCENVKINNSLILNPHQEIKSEASILDLNDVEYADASDGEEEVTDCVRREVIADTMTPAEAENLLSTK